MNKIIDKRCIPNDHPLLALIYIKVHKNTIYITMSKYYLIKKLKNINN